MERLLAISGSPRKGGNSDRLLDKFIEGAKESGLKIEKIYICDKKIAPCDEKNVCFKSGVCHIKDDMQDIYEKLLLADTIVIATPTFFMGPPAQLKLMVDRCQALWARRFVLKKPLREAGEDGKKRSGYLLATSGLDKNEAFIGTRETIKAFYYVLGIKHKADLLVSGVDSKGDIGKKEADLQKAFELGRDAGRQ